MIEAFGLTIPESLEEICQPSRCAVIIYDMQVGVVSQIAEGPDVLLRCQKILASARAKGFRVFFARHTFLPNRVAGIGQLHRSMIWQNQKDPSRLGSMMAQGTDGWQIVPELEPRNDEVIVDKITMSAFEGTFLNIAMRDAQLDAFIIAGIALEVGIEPTVRHGLDLNYLPVVVTDACGSKTPELKQRSLATLTQTGEIWTIDTSGIIAAIS
jgi:nicotinamidase-related amidase